MPTPKVLSVILSPTRAQELVSRGSLEIPVTSGPRIVISVGEPESGQ